MTASKLPLLVCLLSGLSRVSAQYDPGPYRVGVPVKLGPPGNFVTAFQFEDFLSSAPPKQYVATVLTNNEAISISPPAHALPDAHAQQNNFASPGKHREDYQAILNSQPQPQEFIRPGPGYAAHVPQENGREHTPPAQFPQSVEKPRNSAHMHDAVSNDGAIQLPKERLSVSSFSSMQAAKDTFGEQIKVDPKKFQKELDNVEWREEIVFPRPGPPRIKWNPKTYVEDERIVKARNNRYVYAEFRDGAEPDDVLEQTGRKIPPKVKPSLNSRITHATTQYEPARHRPLKTHIPTSPERGNSQGRMVYEQQPFRVKEEEHLRSQFGYVGKPQPEHEVRYYPQKDTGGREEPSSEVDYDRAFRQEPQVRPDRDSQPQTSSGPQISEEDPRTPGVVEYGPSAFDTPKHKIIKYQKGDEDFAAIQQAGYNDEDGSDLPRSRDAHAYRQGRQNRHHRHRDEEPEHDDRSVYNRKVPKYVLQDSTGKALRGDLEEYSRKSAQTHSVQREKIQRHRHEYRPDVESGEIPVTHGHSYRARSEVPRHATADSKYTSGHPRKYTPARNVGGTVRYKRKKKPVYYDDEDGDEGEHEEAQPRRFNIRFENNPGEPFSFRKDNRKGESLEDIDDVDEDDHDDRVTFFPRSVSRSLRVGSEVGEGGVNLSFKLA